jgi:nucleoside-diphosphate-sugar epimerase
MMSESPLKLNNSNDNMTQTAVIAGASGLIGRRIADRLLALGGWDVVGLARHPPATQDVRWIGVDLASAEDCNRKLADLKHVTHVFYAARYDHPEGVPESVDVNTAMLINLVNAVESVAPLRHVHAVHGSKYYGHQLGPVPVPMRESMPRAKNDNFYFEQEDFLIERARSSNWTYTTSRPHAFCDPAIDHPRSIGLVIAVFALIQRELGHDLDFPGTTNSFSVPTQFTDLALLARAIVWMATEPRCANQGFNVVNGDCPRWSELWPDFAACFGMKVGQPMPVRLVDYIKDKQPVWDAVVKKHQLRTTQLEELVLWAYGDYQLRPEWECTSSMDKARALDFTDTVNSREMFQRQFYSYHINNIIP